MFKRIIKKINAFQNNPYGLFYFYILVNLIPSLCLIFTEPFDFTGKLILIVFPLGLYLFLLSIYKNTGTIQLWLFPLLFLHAFQIVLFYLFGEDVIAVDMFLNLVTTNASEAGELLDSIFPSVILVCVIYIPTTILAAIACKRKVYLPFSFRKKTLVVGIILMVISFALTFVAKNKNTGTFTFHQDVYPTNVFYNLGFAINKYNRINKYPETSKDFTFEAYRDTTISKNREIYVLIVGETSRAENWSLYGYDRETTPNLEKDSGVVYYQDALTQSNTTHKSVPIILSAASAENFDVIYQQKSIIEAFKEVGFTAVFLSNQAPNHSFTEYFDDEADYKETFRSGYDGVNNLDEILLPRLEHYIDSVKGNLFVVMHTYGSHFNYKERYPETFSKYKPDNVTDIKKEYKDILVNAYDNSILYTDYFLHNIIQILQKTGSSSTFLYTSDHGEDILDDSRNRFLHASPNPTFYQLRIPMITWFSDVYDENYPQKKYNAINNSDKPVSNNAVFHTLLDMANIKTKYLQDSLSLVNSKYQVTKRMYLDDHDNPIFFYNANLKKQDKEMIEKRGIHH